MENGQTRVLEQIRDRLTIVAVASAVIATAVVIPYVAWLFEWLGRLAMLAVGLTALAIFTAAMIALAARSAKRDGGQTRRGFRPTTRP